MTRAEDPVRHISEKGKPGDQDYHQPELLRVPGAVRTVFSTWQEWQDGSCDHCEAGKGLHVLFVEPFNERMRLLLEGQDQRNERGADNRQGRVAISGQEAKPERGDSRDWTGGVGSCRDIGTSPVADAQDCGRASNQSASRDRLAEAADQSSHAREETEQREGPDTCDTRSLCNVPKIEAPLNSDQQPAGNGGAELKGKGVPFTDQWTVSARSRDATAKDCFINTSGIPPGFYSLSPTVIASV